LVLKAVSPVLAYACASAVSTWPVECPRSSVVGDSQPPHAAADEERPTFSRNVCSSRSGSMNLR
jgi:hypothetical protein